MEDEEEGEGRGILNPGADACGGRYDRPKSSFQLSCGTHPQLFIFHYSFQNGLIFKKMQRVFFSESKTFVEKLTEVYSKQKQEI